MQTEGLQLHKKDSNRGAFLWSLQNFEQCLFLQNTSSDCFGTFDVSFCVFLNKYYLTPILQPCYNVLIVFSSQHIIWYIKCQTRLFINLSSIVRFSEQLRQSAPYIAENWYTWSYEQYLSTHHFLDICQCAFNNFANFTKKHPCWSLFLSAASNFIKIETLAKVFSC